MFYLILLINICFIFIGAYMFDTTKLIATSSAFVAFCCYWLYWSDFCSNCWRYEMSEKLTIEILREKFKEAQERGEELIIENISNNGTESKLVLCVGEDRIFTRDSNSGWEMVFHGDFLDEWKIKQPKDEYEVLPKGTKFDASKLGRVEIFITSDRELLKNKRTGEIVEYNESLLNK